MSPFSFEDAAPAVTVPATTYNGSTAHLIRIQIFTGPGRPEFHLVGLPADSARHTRDRLHAAIVNSGLSWPAIPIIMRTLPGPLAIADAGLDVAFAVALLAGTGQLPPDHLARLVCIGELGLDGRLRTVDGVAQRCAAIADAGAGVAATVVPVGDLTAAGHLLGDTVHGVGTLRVLVAGLRGEATLQRRAGWPSVVPAPGTDLADLPARHPGRRALEVAAAGGHHLALLGPPGSGTVALAHRLPGLLPNVDEPTAAQIAATYRAAGLPPDDGPRLVRPPWQAPHHTSGLAALTGSLLRPGAVALAHGGVLFLDEAGELTDRAIQALREPVEHGRVVVVGDGRRVEYPTRFQLVLASRGCPNTGRHTDGRCGCPARVRRDYLRRLDPLLGLVDLRVSLPCPVPADRDGPPGESTGVVGARVAQARAAAATRWTRYGFTTNAQAGAAALRTDLAGRWGAQAAALLGRHDAARLSFADAIRVLAVAWTIADLGGRDTAGDSDLAEAIRLHSLPVHGTAVR